MRYCHRILGMLMFHIMRSWLFCLIQLIRSLSIVHILVHQAYLFHPFWQITTLQHGIYATIFKDASGVLREDICPRDDLFRLFST